MSQIKKQKSQFSLYRSLAHPILGYGGSLSV